jgi:septal ring factor EnvC (AmiA/AmiB activator)
MNSATLKIIVVSLTVAMLGVSCASNQEALLETDKKLKSMEAQNAKFQKLAIQKIGALEKDVKALKANQAKLGKQIPAIVNQIKVLKAAVAKSGQGVTPEMEAQINTILASLEALEADLNSVKGSEGTGVTAEEVQPSEPFELINGSDQELVFREYGRPAERYTIDNQHQVWLYDSGVVVFDQRGGLVSLKFE